MEYLNIRMVREDLEDIPQVPLPAGFGVRRYRPGDRRTWVRIWRDADDFTSMTPKTFDREFGRELDAMPKRCHFLVAPDGQAVGTATAWRYRYLGRPWGLVHWVAVARPFQGRGLGKGLMTVVLNRLRALGHRRALLCTQTPRFPAIRLYLGFGFVPSVVDGNDARAWRLVVPHISHPALKGI